MGKQAEAAKKKLIGKRCYDHLGGSLGAKLLEFYVSNGWLAPEEGDRNTVYKITEKGLAKFAELGLQIDPDML